MARLRAVVMIHPGGLGGRPVRGQCWTAAEKTHPERPERRRDSRAVGVLLLGALRPDAFEDASLDVLGAMGHLAGIGVDKARLAAGQQRERHKAAESAVTLGTVLESVDSGVCVVELDGTARAANTAFFGDIDVAKYAHQNGHRGVASLATIDPLLISTPLTNVRSRGVRSLATIDPLLISTRLTNVRSRAVRSLATIDPLLISTRLTNVRSRAVRSLATIDPLLISTRLTNVRSPEGPRATEGPASLSGVERTGGDLIVDSLKAAGVDTLFGIISVHNIPIFDALAREGGMRLVPARTEHGAALMADGFARATGRLAAVVTSTGVGAANAAGPLLEAFVASSPVLHITGQVDAAYIEGDRGFLHAAKDQLAMLDCVGKAALRAARTEDIPEVMQRAVRLAVSGRPGPVSVEVPIDQQYRSVNARVESFTLPALQRPDRAALEEAAQLIRRARRPLIWAGGGAIAARASSSLEKLAERIGAGVLTSAAGRGTLPENHPQCIGFFGLEPAVGALYEQCDLLLVVGSRLRGNETRAWQLALPKPRIQIDVEPSLLGRNYPVDVGILGDARLSLEALLDSVPPWTDPDWLSAVAEASRAARARLRSTLGPYERVLDDLRSTLAPDAIVVRDVTIPATTWGARLLETYQPRTVVHSASYAIGLGCCLAIGASIGRPDRQVVLLAGDGGFVTALGELATAAQEKARLTTIVFNDAGYGILRNLQDTYFKGRRLGVDLETPDFVQLGESFGVWTGQVRSSVEMGPVLKEALHQAGPALIEVDMASVGPMAVPFTGSAGLVPG